MMYNGLMCDFAGTIQNLPAFAAYVCAAGVGVCTIGAGAYWIAKKLARSTRQLAAVSLVGAVLIGGMVVVGTDDAGTKPGTNVVTQVGGATNTMTQTEGGTNVLRWTVQGRARIPAAPPAGVANGENKGPALRRSRSLRPTELASITDDDIAKGWRVFSVSSNTVDASVFAFEQSNNQTIEQSPTVWEAAQRRGAVYGHWALPLDEWFFPFGDSGWTHPFLRCEGVLRDSFRDDRNQIRFLAPFALCPAANWPRYSLVASRTWCATNDVGGLTVAVENGALGNNPAQIVRARIDLDPALVEIRLRYDLSRIGEMTFDVGPTLNGTNTFVTVGSNTSEVVFRRVHPDDWDLDGLPNALDPSPRQPNVSVGFNQSDTWAMFAFPSNAAEIASMGYTAWATACAADPNRLLLGIEFASAKNAWPACLTFGNVQVMCDGTQEIVFPIDHGAHYPFSISGGELVGARVVDTMWFADFFPNLWFVPYDCHVGDLTVHLDSPGSGWIGTTAEVSVDGLEGTHFFPNDSRNVTAAVTNCHEDAYIDCTWFGGEGITFSDSHSLTTTVSWYSSDSVEWATNYVDLVTTYKGGYAVTNHHGITVGALAEPRTEFSIGCQKVFFLNDADFLASGKCPTNRPERIRPVAFRLVAACGTGGYVSITNSGTARAVLFQVENGVTNRIDSSTRIRLEVPEGSFARESVKTVYMSCPTLGRGSIRATWTPDESDEQSDECDYQVIEPIRKLVTSEQYNKTGPILNPSRLVFGTNAILKVSVNLAAGDTFSVTNQLFRPVSGSGEILSQWREGNDWYASVRAKSSSGKFVVEAKFNGDAVQPRFELGIVSQRVLPIKAFFIRPPREEEWHQWSAGIISNLVEGANMIYSQTDVRFVIRSIEPVTDMTIPWKIQRMVTRVNNEGRQVKVFSDHFLALLNTYQRGDCIEVYFGGDFVDADAVGCWTERGIFVARDITPVAFAHEMGHALGLLDCYAATEDGRYVAGSFDLVSGICFLDRSDDWGLEKGRGFYDRNDLEHVIMKSLLMYGDESDGMDIPYAVYWGFSDSKKGVPAYLKVGSGFFEPVDEKVFSK